MTNECVTLSWSYGFDGNAPITGVDIDYEATDNSNPDHADSTSTDQISTTICGLQPFTTYQFTVVVNNDVSDEVGSSSPMSISVVTLPLGIRLILLWL